MDHNPAQEAVRLAAIILCGGQSSRMGRPKAWLRFGDEFLLQRVVRLASQVAGTIVVVAASGQDLPELPPAVIRVDDLHPDRGPLEGLATGLACLTQNISHVYLTGTDAPFLVPAWIGRLVALIEDADIAVPIHDSHPQPLAALYKRTTVLPAARSRLDQNQLSLRALLNIVKTKRIEADVFRDVDPNLSTLVNCNTYQEYITVLSEHNL